MSKIFREVSKIFNNPLRIVLLLDRFHLINLDDESYLKLLYRINFHNNLDFDNCITFNEKLQWLKLFDRDDKYSIMVDKYEVKDYVNKLVNNCNVIPTYGVFEHFDEINFNSLPNQFVIKCTHDSGGIYIVKDKRYFNITDARKRINYCLSRDFYRLGREWPYKNVKPRIIVEKYMQELDEYSLIDYKIHCFNGEPKVVLVCKERFSKRGMTEDFFTTSWEHINVKRPHHNNSQTIIEKPKQLEIMLDIAKKLSSCIPFIRVDLYIIEEQIYFGELTFFPATGMERFVPESFDYELGKYISLPKYHKPLEL